MSHTSFTIHNSCRSLFCIKQSHVGSMEFQITRRVNLFVYLLDLLQPSLFWLVYVRYRESYHLRAASKGNLDPSYKSVESPT